CFQQKWIPLLRFGSVRKQRLGAIERFEETRKMLQEGCCCGPSRGKTQLRASNDHPLAGFIMAVRLFSRLPTGSSPHATPNLDRIAKVLPLASLAIGIGPAVLLFLAIHAGLDPLFSALLAAAASAIAGGAMSEDAAADAADGLFGGSTPERRLEILKDSRHGTYGVLTIVFVVGLKAAALAALAVRDPLAAALVWLGAAILARSGSLYVALA